MNGRQVDKRDVLQEGVFDFQITKANLVLLYFQNRHVKTLGGKSAEKFKQQIANATEFEAQLLMAKATGNFKRGNERHESKP